MWTLNFGSQHVEVPWQIGLAVIILGILGSILFATSINRSFVKEDENKYYACSWCGHRFKPEKKKLKRSLHTNWERVLKCPKCGKVDYCAPSYDQDNE